MFEAALQQTQINASYAKKNNSDLLREVNSDTVALIWDYQVVHGLRVYFQYQGELNLSLWRPLSATPAHNRSSSILHSQIKTLLPLLLSSLFKINPPALPFAHVQQGSKQAIIQTVLTKCILSGENEASHVTAAEK